MAAASHRRAHITDPTDQMVWQSIKIATQSIWLAASAGIYRAATNEIHEKINIDCF